ncbi:MAG: hypothetical protein ACE5OZ_11385 [Candidatus Heimdallarchaeota archaeon]
MGAFHFPKQYKDWGLRLSQQFRHSQSVKISLYEFERFMQTYGVTNLNQIGQEYVFSIPVKLECDYTSDPVRIEIFTSISIWDNWSRDRDKDAIRLFLRFHGKTLARRTAYRTDGWEKRLEKKIGELKGLIAPHLLCPSGHPLIVRHNKETQEPFWGCVRFPDCRGTRPFR